MPNWDKGRSPRDRAPEARLGRCDRRARGRRDAPIATPRPQREARALRGRGRNRGLGGGRGTARAPDAAALKEANAILHGIIVLNTGNKELLSKLNTDYDNKGDGAIKYIKSCFSAGENENKEGSTTTKGEDGTKCILSFLT